MVRVIVFSSFMLLINCLSAQSNYFISSYSFKILGTSSMHDWVVSGTKATAKGVFTIESNRIKEIKSLLIKIPAKELKSEKKSSKMDKKIYEALKADDNPDITFNFLHINSYPTEANGYMMNATGTLTICGVPKEESLNVQVKINDNNSISFSGSKKLKMTDFKISPPTAMMGMLKTGNDLEIKFECSMKQN